MACTGETLDELVAWRDIRVGWESSSPVRNTRYTQASEQSPTGVVLVCGALSGTHLHFSGAIRVPHDVHHYPVRPTPRHPRGFDKRHSAHPLPDSG